MFFSWKKSYVRWPCGTRLSCLQTAWTSFLMKNHEGYPLQHQLASQWLLHCSITMRSFFVIAHYKRPCLRSSTIQTCSKTGNFFCLCNREVISIWIWQKMNHNPNQFFALNNNNNNIIPVSIWPIPLLMPYLYQYIGLYIHTLAVMAHRTSTSCLSQMQWIIFSEWQWRNDQTGSLVGISGGYCACAVWCASLHHFWDCCVRLPGDWVLWTGG